MENQLAKLSVTEIKALVYDELAKIEVAQNNVRILNQELRNRLQPQQPAQGGGDVVAAPDFSGAPDA
jgi:hypothetical protein